MADSYFYPEGVYPAMLTPFDSNGRVNEAELRRMVRWQIGQGVSGLFPLGSVGEFVHLGFEEKARVIAIVVDEADGRVPVTPGTAGTCAENCIELTGKAQELGCAAAIIAPPYYFRPITQGMIEEHYRRVAAALPDFSLIIYNIPMFSTPMSYDLVERLSNWENVVGMKDSSGSMVDLMHFMDKAGRTGGRFNILTGREETVLPALQSGAKGAMVGTAGIVPHIMSGIYSAWKDGNLEKARQNQKAVLPLIRGMFALTLPLGFKLAMEIRGFDMGDPKQPLAVSEQEIYQRVKAELHTLLVDLLGEEELLAKDD